MATSELLPPELAHALTSLRYLSKRQKECGLTSAEAAEALGSLETLNGFERITFDMVKNSNAGKVVYAFSKEGVAPDMVREKAAEVMAKWKKILSADTSSSVDTSSSAVQEKRERGANPQKEGDETPAKSAADGHTETSSDTKRRRVSVPQTLNDKSLQAFLGEFYLSTDSGRRNAMRARLFEAISIPASFDDARISPAASVSPNSGPVDLDPEEFTNYLRIASEIENELAKSFGPKPTLLDGKALSLQKNIFKNPLLRIRIQTGHISPEAVPHLSPYDLALPEMQKEFDEIKAKNLKAAKAANVKGAAFAAETDLYTCSRCKSKRCSYYQLQTRSADEPMTTFVRCLTCSHAWKFC